VPSGLIPYKPRRAAGSQATQFEKPVTTPPEPLRPGTSSAAFSIMLGLLETLGNLVLSGQEPAPFLIALPDRPGAPVLVATPDPGTHLRRLEREHGGVPMAFFVAARSADGGVWLEVRDLTGAAGDRLEQFCRRTGQGRMEALPYSWSVASRPARHHATSRRSCVASRCSIFDITMPQ
jgi:hypothetical protein